MNTNQTVHEYTDLEGFLMSVTSLVDGFQEDEGETLDALYIVLSVVATIENCVDEIEDIEFAVTSKGSGYLLRYRTTNGWPLRDEQLDDHLNRALEMARDEVYEAQAGDEDDVKPFDNTMSLPSSTRTGGF